MTGSCETCRFAQNYDQIGSAMCRRYAPRPQAGRGNEMVLWPMVRPHDWCGEYERAGEP